MPLPNLKVQRIKLLFSSSNTADGFLGDYRLTLYDNPSLRSALRLFPSFSSSPLPFVQLFAPYNAYLSLMTIPSSEPYEHNYSCA